MYILRKLKYETTRKEKNMNRKLYIKDIESGINGSVQLGRLTKKVKDSRNGQRFQNRASACKVISDKRTDKLNRDYLNHELNREDRANKQRNARRLKR